ncbi:MAG: hypothetical protein QXW79_01100 [Thermoplasmata archaeon]
MANNNAEISYANDRNLRLEKVVAALEKVDKGTNEMILKMAQDMMESEIIHLFNQTSLDLFNILQSVTKRIDTKDNHGISGYKSLFENAIKINAHAPIDNFTLFILEYAADIYSQNEKIFLNMTIPDVNVTVGNYFGVIRIDIFRKLWNKMTNTEKEMIKDKIILLTTFAHTYLYQSILKNKYWNKKDAIV